MHFSPAVRPPLQADRPEWSVASDAKGGKASGAGRHGHTCSADYDAR
ncbi:hypothetical protein ACODNH_19065 [Haloarcula sp. NS06]